MDNPSTFPLVMIAILTFIALAFVFRGLFTVPQGHVATITRFGKYRRIALSGLNFKNPLLDNIHSVITTQNQSTELEFQAITQDQANVIFKAMLLYSVLDQDEETIKNVSFKFSNSRDFQLALTKSIEGSVRTFVAGKKQSEILGQRQEIVVYVKGHLDEILKSWGYNLIDLQINDVTFDQAIMDSMSKVVASANLRAAAENEGAALLIKKTKEAEAEGASIKIQAQAEKEASILRGEGVAAFRSAIAKGIRESVDLLDNKTDGTQMILFSMYSEMMRSLAENGKGNMIIFDGSFEGNQRDIRKLMGLQVTEQLAKQGS